MDDILSRISDDPALREAVISHLGLSPIASEDGQRTHVTIANTSPASSQGAVSSELASGSSQSVVYTSHSVSSLSNNTLVSQSSNSMSPLAARVHQSGANDPLAARVHQSEVDDALNPDGEHQLADNNRNNPGPSDFDPDQYTADDEYTFVAHSAITNYIEKHFRRMLDKVGRPQMHKEHPVPSTPATKAPKVDGFITDYLKSSFPRSDDTELMKVQSALLKVCGPMACMWAELIDSNLLSDPNATVNVHDVLNVVQRTLVLLGNANELFSQYRRSKILAAVDTSLVKYAQKPRPESGEFLFGSGFTKYLKGEVETDSALAEVVSLSQRFHPYSNNTSTRQSTIGRTKNQFFRGGLARKGGPRQGSYQTPSHYPSQHQSRGGSSYRSRGRGRPFSARPKRY